MKLLSTILCSGAVAFAAAGAMAQETARPLGQAQAGPQGPAAGGPPGGPQGPRGGPGGPGGGPLGRPGGPPGAQQGAQRAPPSIGGIVGTVESLTPTSFVVALSPGRVATVEQSAATVYRNGPKTAKANIVKKGERVVVIGLATVGMRDAGTTVKADLVIAHPATVAKANVSEGNGARPAGPPGAAGAVPFQAGVAPVERSVGKIPANYVQGEGTIIQGAEANKAIEVALANWTGGVVNRVVKLSTGEYEVHNVGVAWPHHIFVDKSFKYLGAQ
ncbi:MAG TPA: hypothetical protein VL460_01550 [Caulobacteraceae bacterium]|jgi:hypothetical protein|nr:hypothetical protein [Caulobacteraceae bacterium]